MTFQTETSPTFAHVRGQFDSLYGFELPYEEYVRLGHRIANHAKHHFDVRLLSRRSETETLWVARMDRPDGSYVFVPVVRNKHSKAVCDVFGPEILEDHRALLIGMRPEALSAFVGVQENMLSEHGYSFFAHADYFGMIERILRGEARHTETEIDGLPVFEVAHQRKPHLKPRFYEVRFDPEDEVIASVVRETTDERVRETA